MMKTLQPPRFQSRRTCTLSERERSERERCASERIASEARDFDRKLRKIEKAREKKNAKIAKNREIAKNRASLALATLALARASRKIQVCKHYNCEKYRCAGTKISALAPLGRLVRVERRVVVQLALVHDGLEAVAHASAEPVFAHLYFSRF